MLYFWFNYLFFTFQTISQHICAKPASLWSSCRRWWLSIHPKDLAYVWLATCLHLARSSCKSSRWCWWCWCCCSRNGGGACRAFGHAVEGRNRICLASRAVWLCSSWTVCRHPCRYRHRRSNCRLTAWEGIWIRRLISGAWSAPFQLTCHLQWCRAGARGFYLLCLSTPGNQLRSWTAQSIWVRRRTESKLRGRRWSLACLRNCVCVKWLGTSSAKLW